MAGYGNRTAPTYDDATDLAPEYTSTRLGLIDSHTAYHNPHEKHGSGTTSGAGFGMLFLSLPLPPLSLPFPSLSPFTYSLSLSLLYINLTTKATNAPPSPPRPHHPPPYPSPPHPPQPRTQTRGDWAAGRRLAQGTGIKRGRWVKAVRILCLGRRWRRWGVWWGVRGWLGWGGG